MFTTPNPPGSAVQGQAAAETTWIVIDYDPAEYRIAYLWINPGRVITELRIQLASGENGGTRTRIRYRYTGLSPEGNRELERYTREWFESNMKNWETTINHYLRTGKMSA